MIEEIPVLSMEGISAQPTSITTGSADFEQAYHQLMIELGYVRPVVWRGIMPSVVQPISFVDKYDPKPNKRKILAAENFISRESETGIGTNFFLVYQGILGMHDTLITYVFSRDQAVIKNRATQTARHGTYVPKMYRTDSRSVIPPINGYQTAPMSIKKMVELIPGLVDIIDLKSDFYATLRLASYLFQRSYPLPSIENEDLIVNVYHKYPNSARARQKYLVEITQRDGRSGVRSVGRMRLWETNDPNQGVLRRWKGPIPTQSLRVTS